MPQFHLDVHDDYGRWKRLDAFTQGYIEALFFTEMEHGTTSETHEPETQSSLPGDMTFADLSQTALATIVAECEAFQETHAALLESVYGVQGRYESREYDAQRAGNDFWYTRNGHGTGFWDRGLDDAGDKLADICRATRNQDAYMGDDGQIHV